MKTHARTSILLAAVLLVSGCGGTPERGTAQLDVTPAEAQAIAREAFLWGYPIVMNYKTIYSYAIDKQSPDYKGPFNEVSCAARLFTPADTAVVTPNSDTPYGMFWLDLRAEPMVLSVPEMEPERFYHFQFVDLYTHNYAYVGTLTTGNGAGTFLVAGPDWDGDTPDGITDVIRSETGLVFSVTRTQLFGPDDLEKVRQIQSGYRLEPLSRFVGTEAPSSKPLPEFATWTEGAQLDGRFLDYLDLMMDLLGAPAKGDESLWKQLARLGVGTEGKFTFAALAPELQAALQKGVKDGLTEVEGFIAENSSDPLMSAKIFGTRTSLTEIAQKEYELGRPDLLRSAAAHLGLYGNSAQEAIYPAYMKDADGQPLDASQNSYTITFAAGALPPVKSFWSLTMYDAKTQLLIENPLDRYLLNSTMLEQFKREDDGSLVLHIAKDSPGPDIEANWLPAPDGPFYVVMRLYGPEESALAGGSWSPPPFVTTNAAQGEGMEPSTGTSADLSAEEIDNLVRRTYAFVAMFNVINKAAMMEENPMRTGWNGTYAATGLADHNAKAIARPNNDTLYITTVMDLRTEPVIVSYPAFDSKFVALEVSAYDHYVDIPLSTTRGDFKEPTKVLYYAARTPEYGGEPVDGVDRIIEMTGDFAIAFLRVMPHAAEPERLAKNLAAMKQVQAVTLSEFRGGAPKPHEEPTFPAYDTDEGTFEKNFLEVMQFAVNHTTFDPNDDLDAGVLAALEPLGVAPGKTFDASSVTRVDGKALAAAAKRIHAEALKIWTNPEGNPYVNDLFLPKGEMKLAPMVVQSAYGPIGLPAHQAVYPGIPSADGEPLNAQHDYVIRIPKEEMPPSTAFWSVTLYDAKNGFFIPNDRKKYSVGENAGMKLADDGGIEIYIAARKPEGVPEENWLPIKRRDEALDLVMRIYAPDVERMKTWEAPVAEKLETGIR